MVKYRGSITIIQEDCKGCGLCVAACPLKLLVLDQGINHKGYHPATMTDQTKCTACAQCGLMCPDVLITVERHEANK